MKLTAVRKEGKYDYLRPDGKTQVTVEYEGDKPVRVDTVVLSTQHSDKVSLEQLREEMIQGVILEVISRNNWKQYELMLMRDRH